MLRDMGRLDFRGYFHLAVYDSLFSRIEFRALPCIKSFVFTTKNYELCCLPPLLGSVISTPFFTLHHD